MFTFQCPIFCALSIVQFFVHCPIFCLLIIVHCPLCNFLSTGHCPIFCPLSSDFELERGGGTYIPWWPILYPVLLFKAKFFISSWIISFSFLVSPHLPTLYLALFIPEGEGGRPPPRFSINFPKEILAKKFGCKNSKLLGFYVFFLCENNLITRSKHFFEIQWRSRKIV